MDAPVYTPATAFEQPADVPTAPTVAAVSLAEIMAATAAWAIVLKHAPVMKMIVGGKQIQPFLTNMMVESFIVYGGVITPAQLAAIDADFARLPAADRPVR